MNTYTFFKSLLATAIAITPFYAEAQMRPHCAARTTAMADSLLLISHAADYYDSALGFVHVDSSTFSYSGGRGTNKHDVQSYYRFDTSFVGSSLNWRKTYSFDAGNNMTADLYEQWDPAGGFWSNRRFYTYDASGDLVFIHADIFDNFTSTWSDDLERTYSYTATHKPDTVVERYYAGLAGPWITNTRATYTYDASDNLATELHEGWAGITWMGNFRHTYSYDGHNNRVVNYAERYNPLTSWEPWARDSSAYDAADNMIHNELIEWNTVDSAWRPSRIADYSGFVAHQPLLITTRVWEPLDSSFHNGVKITNTYNSQSKIEFSQQQSWNEATSAWYLRGGDGQHRYHYANVAVGVPDVALPANGEIKIFPVPAKDALTIDLEWNEPQPFTISIIDMMGRVCGTWGVAPCAKHKETIPLHYFAAGNYTIKAVGAKASASRVVTIEK